MDPYLEAPGGWGGVHGRLIAIIGELLNRDLGPDFAIMAARSPARGGIAAPLHVSPGEPATIEQPYILIRDRASRRVVTIIELLSPINKLPTAPSGAVPPAREEFLEKRRATMASTTHWLELDLLRAGERPAEVRGAGDYYALLKRVGTGLLDVWPISLRDPLPTIAVPLVAPHADVALDLQAAVDLLFERYRYAELLNYDAPPPAPALQWDDARWVGEHVARWWAAQRGNGAGQVPPAE
jgi:hypothetical protein